MTFSLESQNTRVRYAPSPTGFLHVGGARTLLFNWLYAKKHGGKLILRIEDTDQARSTRESERMILSDVRMLGFDYAEGPEVGGPHAPYRQSERLPVYGEHAKKLLDQGLAYYCFCSDELLSQKRELAMKLGKTPHYDGTCLKISPDEARSRVLSGQKAGLRFKATQKDFTLHDVVRGNVEFRVGMVGDFFITRTPTAGEKEIAEGIGMPVYNFCCVIDDHAMGMTHVIRGEDHLSNTARQLMIYDAFGWKPPVFAHTAMVLGTDRQKLSKRNGDSSVHDYLDKGFMPEALLNFLALLGWWPPQGFKPKSGHPEILSLDELAQTFNLEGLQKAPAVFDVQKLSWMNSQYIKLLPLSLITERARTFFEKAGLHVQLKKAGDAWFEGVIETVRGECALLSQLPEAAQIFFEATPTLDDAAREILKAPGADDVIAQFVSELEQVADPITAEAVELMQKGVGNATGAKGKALFMTIRAVITGRTHGPEMKKVLPLLGKERALARAHEILRQLRT